MASIKVIGTSLSPLALETHLPQDLFLKNAFLLVSNLWSNQLLNYSYIN